MFFCAVANPQYDDEGNCTFDGKLGIWPFIREIPKLTCFFCFNWFLWFALEANMFVNWCRNQQKEQVVTDQGGHQSTRQ